MATSQEVDFRAKKITRDKEGINDVIKSKGEGGSGWGIHVTPWLIHVNV